jgi:YVTN family beta-propeller protein
MPQDIRISPDGKLFFVADMMADGVFVVDGESVYPDRIHSHWCRHPTVLSKPRRQESFTLPTAAPTESSGPPKGKGSVSVIDFATRTVETTWPIPGGGSPDMGNVSADGKYLWLAGRYDNVVYVIDTATGAVNKIPVGKEPHGLTVWPQPGRYSLGHTGNMR